MNRRGASNENERLNNRRRLLEENSKTSKSQNRYNENDYDEDNPDDSPWIFIKVHLKRERGSFGMAFINDKSPHRQNDLISITKIVRGGVAEKDGRLKVGDIIVSVNGVEFDDVRYETAIETLRNTGPNMTMLVRRIKEYEETDEIDYANQTRNIPPSSPYESDNSFESDNEDFQQLEIKLRKINGGLGINIHGGYDSSNEDEEKNYIKISKLAPSGVAAADGRLKVGDIILQVDYQSFNGLTYDEAIDVLKRCGKEVTIYVGRYSANEMATNKQGRSREI